MRHIRYIEKQNPIRAQLVKLARQKPLLSITYEELAKRVGIPKQGPWDILNLIAHEEIKAGRPDITYLIVTRKTRYPSVINGERVGRPAQQQRDYVDGYRNKIAEFYAVR